MACDVNNHNPSTFQFVPENIDQFHHLRPKPKLSKKQRCLTIFAGIFLTGLILCIAAALALILTQKPVNFDEINESSYNDGTAHVNPKLIKSQRRYPEAKYISHTYADIYREQPFTGAFQMWYHDDTIIIKEGSDYYTVDPNNVNHRELFLIGKNVLSGEMFVFNSNGKYVAISRFAGRRFRHSATNFYFVAQFSDRHFIDRKPVGIVPNSPIQLLEWSPAKNAIDFVYVFENNIYYQGNPNDPTSAKQVTFSGSHDVFNGVADWLYEEEIFSTSKALWWSKSGNYLAYASIDDKNVSEIALPHYSKLDSFPMYDYVPYPKTGTKDQPRIMLFIWDKTKNNTQIILPPNDLLLAGSESSYYLFKADWVMLESYDGRDLEYFIAIWANRNQNHVYITACQYQKTCRLLKKIDFIMNGYEHWGDPDLFTIKYASKTGFFILLPREHPDGNVYTHVAHVDVVKDGKYFPVSGFHGGSYDVGSIAGYDKARDELFFISQGGIIGEEHLFRVPYASVEDNIAPQCVTCMMEGCKAVSADFSPSGKQILITCMAPYKNPVVYLKKTNNIVEHSIIYDEYTNGTEFNPDYDLPIKKFETLQLDSGYEAHVSLLLPPNFNSKYTYPVLLHVYAGPNTNQVNSYNPEPYLTYFASVRQYIIVSIDGRGSGNRGWKLRSPMYKNLGGPEVEDQIDGLKKLIKKYPFMDSEKVATMGWSYGGFVTSHIVAKDAGVTVKCAISVAPVVDFLFYDSAYTERYMMLPEENPDGYLANSLLNDTKIINFKKVKFLLAHGEADDNVHFQNSALLANLLQRHEIHFTQLVYPNQDHGIAETRNHLVNEFDFFLQDCFNLNYL
uniref:Uncharacterized protein n=1 Tax=Panagrolaimus sp. JU765 TaxID=591449 RepID=A0AC34QKF8_9BILA